MSNYKTGNYVGSEKEHLKTVYQWRCTPKEKERLLIQAATEGRTANKILSDALENYLMEHDEKGKPLGNKDA